MLVPNTMFLLWDYVPKEDPFPDVSPLSHKEGTLMLKVHALQNRRELNASTFYGKSYNQVMPQIMLSGYVKGREG